MYTMEIELSVTGLTTTIASLTYNIKICPTGRVEIAQRGVKSVTHQYHNTKDAYKT